MKKTIIILISILLIISLVVYGIIKIDSRNYNNIKLDKNNYLVYTIESNESGYYIQNIPFINIKGQIIEVINKDINDFTNKYKEDNININYEYNISGKILSLILKIEDHSKIEDATIASFRSYIINLDTLELLSNKEILNYFNLTEQDINILLGNKINDDYTNLVNNSVIKQSECNYNCYLNNRGINQSNYLDGTYYFIRDGKLIVFKAINFIPLYEKEEIEYEYEIDN